MRTTFILNGRHIEVDADADSKLLWLLRDQLKLTGTKYSCGLAQCGACTVHLDGNPVRSCVVPVSSLKDKEVLTIEGLSNGELHPVQKAWIEEQVPQCGYCQSGQIMQAAALLEVNKNPSREEICSYMDGVLCRCGAYTRIVTAIQTASKIMEDE